MVWDSQKLKIFCENGFEKNTVTVILLQMVISIGGSTTILYTPFKWGILIHSQAMAVNSVSYDLNLKCQKTSDVFHLENTNRRSKSIFHAAQASCTLFFQCSQNI